MDEPRPTYAVKQQLQAYTTAKSDIGDHGIIVDVQRLDSCAHEVAVAAIERAPSIRPPTPRGWPSCLAIPA